MTELKIPQGMHWSCDGHCVCCTSLDAGLTSAEIATLEGLAGRELREFSLPDPANPAQSILAKPAGRCVFLSPEGRCSIHQSHGVSAKPLVCRQFPFLFVQTPQAIQAGLSFTCPSAVLGEGAPLEDSRAEMEALLAQGAPCHALPETLELDEDLALDWADYPLIEEALKTILSRTELTMEEALVAGSVWLNMLNLFVREAHQKQVPPREAITYFVESMAKNEYQRVSQIARRRHGSSVLQRAFLGMLVYFRNSLSVRRSVPTVVCMILWSYARHLLRVGSMRIAPLDKPFRYAAFKQVAFDPSAPEADAILRRVLIHCIERKDLLRGNTVLRGYGLLIIFYAMIRWYAVMLAAQRQATRVEQADLVQAVSLAERYYGAHSRFFELFQKYPVLNGIFFNLLRQKHFAHSMVYPVG